MNLPPSGWLLSWMTVGFIALPLCARADEVLLPVVVDGKWGFEDRARLDLLRAGEKKAAP